MFVCKYPFDLLLAEYSILFVSNECVLVTGASQTSRNRLLIVNVKGFIFADSQFTEAQLMLADEFSDAIFHSYGGAYDGHSRTKNPH
jgi:hypothetical protein